jgi:hypothetical protein
VHLDRFALFGERTNAKPEPGKAELDTVARLPHQVRADFTGVEKVEKESFSVWECQAAARLTV